MKKLTYSLLIITALVIVSSCNLFCKKSLVGKWEHTNSTASENFVLELTSDTWTYYKNNVVLEKGQLEIDGDQLIMGHEAEEGHDQDHAPHAYTWSLSEDETTLTLSHDNTKSVFLRKK